MISILSEESAHHRRNGGAHSLRPSGVILAHDSGTRGPMSSPRTGRPHVPSSTGAEPLRIVFSLTVRGCMNCRR